jgi:ribonuclease D
MSDQTTILGDIREVTTIAAGASVRETKRLRKMYGRSRWRKLKGQARVRLPDQTVCLAEVHWYEAHGVGRKEIKVKHIIRFE